MHNATHTIETLTSNVDRAAILLAKTPAGMPKLLRRRERALEAAQSALRIAKAQAETRAVVKTGNCPCCGAGLRRNPSLTGWWQCEQYGSEGFRKDSARPACSWQGFTE